MRPFLSLPFALASLVGFTVLITPALAQRDQHDPLTEAQVEKIREAGIDPNERIKLYTEYVNDHVNTVKSLMNRGKSDARSKRIDNALHDVSSLMDELGSNLDEYSERHADMRPALKKLADESQDWLTTLRALAGEPAFDLSRKEAIEAGQDLSDQAQRLVHEQTDYFALHKNQKGQERAEPNPQ
jgi:hypothetical protein